jgi:hypothetical protein
LNPVDKRPTERRSFVGESIHRVLDEIGGTRIVLGQVDEPSATSSTSRILQFAGRSSQLLG